MDEILDRLKSLDNVQLRAELLKHGERVGPVTPTTRDLFLSRLAQKLHSVEYPSTDATEHDNRTSSDPSDESTGDPIIDMTDGAKRYFITDMPDRKKGNSIIDTTVAAGRGDPNGLATTPTERKSLGTEKEACMYYVIIPDHSTSAPASVDNKTVSRVFTDKQEALVYMKKTTGSRLKVFHSSADVQHFKLHGGYSQGQGTQSKGEGGQGHSPAVEAERSAFKGPRIQELVQFRRLVEKGEVDTVRKTVWSNPRYLITGADTPVILHEGMRHNALHIAARANQAAVAELVLETILNPEFTWLLYNCAPHQAKDTHHRRIHYLFDLYLNSPDKGSAETPLHIACKMGHPAVVHSLLMYSATHITRVNKYGEKPEEIICSRYKGDKSSSIKEQIQELLKGLCLVPLLRSMDNVTLPVVGEPCSPDDKARLCSSVPPSTLFHIPREPRLTLRAYAGPMSPSKAQNFQKQWMNPRCSRNMEEAQEFTIARRADSEKGYERIGRKLAKELHVPWTEYWQFLDAFADFSTTEGLGLLEQHLVRQQVQLAIVAAMERRERRDSSGDLDSSTDASAEDSQDDCFYSCDEGSEEEGRGHTNIPSSHLSHGMELAEEQQEDVFEDSLDYFFDTQSYLFGQRLQLKKSLNTNDSHGAIAKEENRAPNEFMLNVSTPQKPSQEKLDLWCYRDGSRSGEEERNPSEDSLPSNTTPSFHMSSPCREEKPGVPQPTRNSGEKNLAACKTSSQLMDKSFNTVMTELSDVLQSKLVFSPEGQMVTSRTAGQEPDVGLCLGENQAHAVSIGRGSRCALDILIRCRTAPLTFLADVLLHSSDTDRDDSSQDLPELSTKQVLMAVTLVARNGAVFHRLRGLWHAQRVWVGILEAGAKEVTQHCHCLLARIVRQKPSQCQPTPCYIHGNTASKTDLDVMRAMCDVDVDSEVFPTVHAWLSLVTDTQQEGRSSWPSPAKLQHQHRLSELQKSMGSSSSPFPISPLVQEGMVTSTPVSRGGFHHTPPTGGYPSPDQSGLKGTPRVWLFKSPP